MLTENLCQWIVLDNVQSEVWSKAVEVKDVEECKSNCLNDSSKCFYGFQFEESRKKCLIAADGNIKLSNESGLIQHFIPSCRNNPSEFLGTIAYGKAENKLTIVSFKNTTLSNLISKNIPNHDTCESECLKSFETDCKYGFVFAKEEVDEKKCQFVDGAYTQVTELWTNFISVFNRRIMSIPYQRTKKMFANASLNKFKNLFFLLKLKKSFNTIIF
ncbi:hypothetical protein HELRODRAFT_168040 [Helobdella robusta]|uniref:Apple domain-containing protein n=1 Tax=Helobdella robusta TaxID=6412 RepID=T1F037_HELRO|nr:hypothetical protein HELRODRAFT_168040 [Helobdella robusta]ESO10172.1 hypothetical protein HELRODRAFT_168040 [Helobdella robusta]